MNPEEEEVSAAAAAHISAHEHLGGRDESVEARLTRTFSLRGGERGGVHRLAWFCVRESCPQVPATAGLISGAGGGTSRSWKFTLGRALWRWGGLHSRPSGVCGGRAWWK